MGNIVFFISIVVLVVSLLLYTGFSSGNESETTTAPDTIVPVETTKAEETTVPADIDFTIGDDVLIAEDGSVHFSLTAEGTVDVQKFVEAMNEIRTSKYFAEGKTKFVFGDTLVINARNEIYEDDPLYNQFIIESFSVFGQTFNLSDSKYKTSYSDGVCETNARLNLQLSNDVFIYAKTRASFGYYLIITKENIYEYHCPEEIFWGSVQAEKNPTWYNESVYSYNIDENGRLIYIREPKKYAFDQTYTSEVRFCVGLDELAREEGYVTFDNENILHHPERSYTVSDIFDIHGIFKTWYDTYKDYDEEYLLSIGLPKVDTLEELIEYNKAHYEAAK